MSFHSLLEGFALGVQDTTTRIMSLFVSLILHKSVEAFSVGLQISKGNKEKTKTVIITILIYAFMTPLGSILGTALQTRHKEQQKRMNDEIPVVVATIAFETGIDKANAKKGLNDDAKDIQSKALQTGFEKMIEYCEKAECKHKLMASFFNESDLKKCLKNCDFCRIPERVDQQANALKTVKTSFILSFQQRQENLYSRSQRQNGEAHESFGYEPRQKKEEEEYSEFENGLERMEKEEAARLKTAVHDEFERRCKARELTNGGAERKVRRVTRHCCSGRQFLPDRQPADIEYNSCYFQSKTLSSYNHKAAQVLSAIRNATRNGTEYDSSSASAI
ncbi:hypothetical protein WR25_04266 [Diploscapter pachys]|uniref:ATP-dependent DNA helicase RecQ zinc-binding domain-containing protein n=1 Tax=Diploscapter pachys TaxID=2018661 RepID=A0A2A2K1M0_9BILA|nr:hypothetical protein WR25_04266 [Diploscapter pachys]